MSMQFSANSLNEGLARITIAAFIMPMDPTLEQLTEIKTVISEAVTNAIIHGYENNPEGIVYLSASLDSDTGKFSVEIRDNGCGISNIDVARQPLYTSKPELERSGMGFTIMESFTDSILIESQVHYGTTVKLEKHFSKNNAFIH